MLLTYLCFTAAPPAPLSTSCMPSSQCLKLQHVSLTHHQALWARSLPRLCQMSISLGPHLDWGRQALDQFHALVKSFFFISNIQFFKMIYNKKTFNLSFIVAAQLHILTLLEHVKEQQMAIAAAVNNLAARLGTEAPVAEMPKDISIPLTTVPEVEEFEEWLKDSGNS
ncbi:hypothetical protein XENTR_v10002249 [Xenopus tropicalis]|nr:hypothetical protein XENTR_v10021404 [Xenopus tropicalis]KAE8585686.1 hypothetical protein XENTR_v10021404 [Xenopus tropicalis]KAE8634271.1 hypothetical protein XENTR_v10002249 [Xenopus tropicalis]KAE8634272.1 hypothetical protein XENTR_v10002249 [Xenopus tropicalis]KAE8634273.1 hypothetical protein XENTR_v10002249 [Xenopus tropicalis]